MNMRPLFSRFCNPPTACRAAILLVALAWSSLAFCGEIHNAAHAGDLEKVKALLKDNPGLVFTTDDSRLTPLHCAAMNDQQKVVELLLANKANVNAKAQIPGTPLHSAAYKGDADIVQLLLANKADVTAKDDMGRTPLDAARESGHKDVVELLKAIAERSGKAN